MGFFDKKDIKVEDIEIKNIPEQSCQEKQIAIKESTNKSEVAKIDNNFVNAMTNNNVAVQMAKDSYNEIKNQKNIAKNIEKVVTKNTMADIEQADLTVEEKRKQNKEKKQAISNRLYELKQERKRLVRESKHKLAMQKVNHWKEKYGDLLLRHCRKKVKNAEGKWEYQKDKNGDAIINMPNSFTLFFLIIFDSIVMFLNEITDVFGGLNKVVVKALWIILLVTLILVPPIRIWLFSLVGINLG